jgi:hypothetical protein
MTNEERMDILQLVENGDVTVEDAIGMMSSGLAREDASSPTESAPPAAEPTPTPTTTKSNRWLRVRVTNLETGRRKVSVNLPLGLMKWGLTMGSRFAPELQDIDLDELVTDLDRYAEGFLVEVEDTDDNERVEVYVE